MKMEYTIEYNGKTRINISTVKGHGQAYKEKKFIGGWFVQWSRHGEEGDACLAQNKRDAKRILIEKLTK